MPGEASKRDYWKHRDERLSVSRSYYEENRAYILAGKKRRLSGTEGDEVRRKKRERDARYRYLRRMEEEAIEREIEQREARERFLANLAQTRPPPPEFGGKYGKAATKLVRAQYERNYPTRLVASKEKFIGPIRPPLTRSEIARCGGKVGGPARAAALDAKRRREISAMGGAARGRKGHKEVKRTRKEPLTPAQRIAQRMRQAKGEKQ